MNLDAEFYAHHWQKAPWIGRGAVDLTALTPSVDQLWDWARASTNARLIQPDQNFLVTLNPTAPPTGNHTLLVGQIEQLCPRWDAWSRSLACIGRWSFSDLMISHACAGASVGAHRDQYDVFLIQIAGQRRWDIGTTADRELPESDQGGSKLLQGFVADNSVTLSAGDVLYVPPGCGHHGVALDDDCMTLSVGFRQPRVNEVLEQMAELAPDQLMTDLRSQAPGTDFGDPAQARQALLTFIQNVDDEVIAAATALACTQQAESDSDANTQQVRFHSAVRAASIDHEQAAVMGELFEISATTLSLLVHSNVDIGTLNEHEQRVIEEFRDAGWLEDA